MKRQAQLLLLTVGALCGTSTLQNYDATFPNDNLAPLVGKPLKLTLLVLFILPLGLSVAYKTFANGATTLDLAPISGYNYELGGSVGNLSWVGVALMANVTLLPIQADIKDIDQSPLQFPSFHGFDMYVINESTTAMLDSPNESTIGKSHKRLPVQRHAGSKMISTLR